MKLKKILMISDTHFSKENALLFEHYDAEKSFDQLVLLIQQESPDYIFVAGDISQDGSPESYVTAKNKLNKLRSNKFVIMGNHDSGNFSNIFAPNIISADYLDIDNHRFIFVSSYKGEGYNEGYVNKKELLKIKKYFDHNHIVYVITHHHFIKANSVMDKSIMDNHAEFCQYLSQFNIRAIFHGHVHNNYDMILGHINVHAIPSTCVQFAKQMELCPEPVIGFRTIMLKDEIYETNVITQHIQN